MACPSLHALVFVGSPKFLLHLVTVQALCNLARAALELHRLDDICVSLEVSLSTLFTVLHFFIKCFNTDFSSWRLVVELCLL